MHELIVGGQRSGKSRCAERRAAAWLAAQPTHSAVLLATARAGDDEMRLRIAHHRLERAERVPRLETEEVPFDLEQAVSRHSAPGRLVIVDCLTMWLTNLLMPLEGAPLDDIDWDLTSEAWCDAISAACGPLLLVSNEIGLGVSPLSPQARGFVDRLGRLHQVVAARCSRVTLMVAGIEVPVKRAPR
ncbi:MAG: bifunctional adenosylcobinamide kinase/adenosylcobinamide-phosphate guanylyltransferase [Burkholderiaceae bacterium]|nr:bifunctional adenosylcobinamide kinase/adenosylcobinamide-phosphate guanylyltransferase [Burkholderiaceae bacterium]